MVGTGLLSQHLLSQPVDVVPSPYTTGLFTTRQSSWWSTCSKISKEDASID